MRRTTFILASLLALAAAPLAAQSDVPRTTMSGEVEILGCSPAPAQIHLHANPVRPVDKADLLPTNMGVSVARVSPRTDRAYPFTFTGLDPKKAYSLSVKFQAEGCGKVAWQGPNFVMPGQTGIRITGFAVRTQIEIGDTNDAGSPTWVGARAVNLLDPQAVTRIRVFSDQRTLKSYVVQFSTNPFTMNPRLMEYECSGGLQVPGLLASKTFEAAGPGWTETTVNLNAIVIGTLTERAGLAGGPAAGVVSVGAAGVAGTDDQDGHVELTPQAVAAKIALRQVQMGAPVYMRVTPVVSGVFDGGSGACRPETDGVGGWAVVANAGPSYAAPSPVGQSTLDVNFAHYHPAKVYEWPQNGQRCYRLTRDYTFSKDLYGFDLLGWAETTEADVAYNFLAHAGAGIPLGATWPKGSHFCISNPDGADAAVQTGITLVSGALEAIGFMVTSAARIWDQVKTAVAAVIASSLTAFGADCDPGSICRMAIEGGIDMALAAAGMPPSIPNWDELQEQGLNYVAATIADQTGVPSSVVEYGVDKVADKMMKDLGSKRGGDGDSLPTWLQHDFGFEPAWVTLSVSQNRADLLPPTRSLSVLGGPQLLGADAPVPSAVPDRVDIPLVLRPNIAGLPTQPLFYGKKVIADELWTKTFWVKQNLSNPCVPLVTVTSQTPAFGAKPSLTLYYLSALLWWDTAFGDDPATTGPPYAALTPGIFYDGCK